MWQGFLFNVLQGRLADPQMGLRLGTQQRSAVRRLASSSTPSKIDLSQRSFILLRSSHTLEGPQILQQGPPTDHRITDSWSGIFLRSFRCSASQTPSPHEARPGEVEPTDRRRDRGVVVSRAAQHHRGLSRLSRTGWNTWGRREGEH